MLVWGKDVSLTRFMNQSVDRCKTWQEIKRLFKGDSHGGTDEDDWVLFCLPSSVVNVTLNLPGFELTTLDKSTSHHL